MRLQILLIHPPTEKTVTDTKSNVVGASIPESWHSSHGRIANGHLLLTELHCQA